MNCQHTAVAAPAAGIKLECSQCLKEERDRYKAALEGIVREARGTADHCCMVYAKEALATSDFPLPRCNHGHALKDHAGERLEPTCGCRFTSESRKP
jgi:hypothetical protein